MMSTTQALITIAVIAACTFLTRALPFLLFPADKPTPAYILYLGKVLPFAITGLLVVYCLSGVSIPAYPHGIPEAIAIAAVAGLYLWRKNHLLAIGAGTVVYMFLVQTVFPA